MQWITNKFFWAMVAFSIIGLWAMGGWIFLAAFTILCGVMCISWFGGFVTYAKNALGFFLIFTVLAVLLEYSMTISHTDSRYEKIASDMAGNNPSLVDADINAGAYKSLEASRISLDSADIKEMGRLEYLVKTDPKNARIYMARIVAIRDSGLARNEFVKKFRQSVKGSSGYVQAVSEESAPLGRTFPIIADSLTKLDYVMAPGRTYRLISNHRYKIKCLDGMYYDMPTELDWTMTYPGGSLNVLASQDIKLTITELN